MRRLPFRLPFRFPRRAPFRSLLRSSRLLLPAAVLGALLLATVVVDAWWDKGHLLTGRLAAEKLPEQMPGFFRNAVDQLAYLNYEPDRWKDRAERTADSALYGGTSPEHYINFERVSPNLFKLANRFDFLAAVGRQGMNGNQVGLLPYRMLEQFQSTRVGFRLWRAAPDAGTRAWIEQRIIDDAGILGHFVADAANPLHATMHHNGWASKKNPNNFTRDDTLHARFEGKFVDARIDAGDVRSRVTAGARVIAQPRQEILQFLQGSHARVAELYRLEGRERFTEQNASPEHKAFVAERLALGALFLRDLWWTAWATSADAPPPAPSTR